MSLNQMVRETEHLFCKSFVARRLQIMSHFHAWLHRLWGCSPERHGFPRSEISHDGIRRYYWLCSQCGERLIVANWCTQAAYTPAKTTGLGALHRQMTANTRIVLSFVVACLIVIVVLEAHIRSLR